jgi:hypothetical protein
MKRWLNWHQGANTRDLFLPINKLGIRFSLPSDVYNACQLVKRFILKCSKNQEIKNLYRLEVKKYVEEERLLESGDRNIGNKLMRKETVNGIVNNMEGLQEQNTILKEVRNLCTGKVINQWHEITEEMTSNIFKFARKALIFSLPTNTNLKRWKKTITDDCLLCNRKQTQLHVLNNCATAANDGRYTWRHDSILCTIMHYTNQLANEGYEICYSRYQQTQT